MLEVIQGTLVWVTFPDEIELRKQVDHERYVYRVSAWPLPSWSNPMKVGVYIAPKQERK